MKKIFLALAIALFMGGFAMAKDDGPKQVNSTQLKQTLFSAYINAAMLAEKNIIYCSTFQLAWNILSDDIIKEPLRLNNNSLTPQMLNKRLIGKKDISPEAYLAMAGYKKGGIIAQINKALKAKFGGQATPLKENLLKNPDDILAYAFLYKNLKFAKEFESLTDPVIFDNGKERAKVKAFGIKKFEYGDKYKDLIKQVTILHYKDDSEFTIKLNSISAKDEIILAKIAPKATLTATIEEVNKMINTIPNSNDRSRPVTALQSGDTLWIPKLDFDIVHNYRELEGSAVLNKKFTGYVIAKAMQSIRFRLNEKGALLKSEAQIIMSKGAIMGEKNKHLVFDKPFLICLKEKGAAYPYLAIWVNNAEILIRE